MKFYKDKEKNHEITELDLGIVEAGNSKTYTIWLENDSPAFLKDIKCIIEHEEVEILECPSELSAYTDGEIKIKWSPNITLREGLKVVLHIKTKELWG